jgi:hypothetical protein
MITAISPITAARARSEKIAPLTHTALTVVEPAAPAAAPVLNGRSRPDAGLIVQLIAHAEGMDWTREKRRASPEVAMAAYRTAAATPARPGREWAAA